VWARWDGEVMSGNWECERVANMNRDSRKEWSGEREVG
jgi:hypothetical protein